MKLGAHVSAAAELPLALERASHIGAECIQIFISPPQQWLQIQHPDSEIQAFRGKAQTLAIGPNFIHGTYLVNLGTQNEEHLKKSVSWLQYGMGEASLMGAKGVIFHLGSHKKKGFETVKKQIIESLKEILKNAPGETELILETAAGSGGVIGRFEELGEILRVIQNDRLKICLDTQHTFALGYDLSTKEGIEKALEEFNQTIGLQNLSVIHCNDSKVECGSLRDRHENIGEGFIGEEGFKGLLHHSALQDIPFILEVPGFSGQGPDKENIEILKRLRLTDS